MTDEPMEFEDPPNFMNGQPDANDPPPGLLMAATDGNSVDQIVEPMEDVRLIGGADGKEDKAVDPAPAGSSGQPPVGGNATSGTGIPIPVIIPISVSVPTPKTKVIVVTSAPPPAAKAVDWKKKADQMARLAEHAGLPYKDHELIDTRDKDRATDARIVAYGVALWYREEKAKKGTAAPATSIRVVEMSEPAGKHSTVYKVMIPADPNHFIHVIEYTNVAPAELEATVPFCEFQKVFPKSMALLRCNSRQGGGGKVQVEKKTSGTPTGLQVLSVIPPDTTLPLPQSSHSGTLNLSVAASRSMASTPRPSMSDSPRPQPKTAIMQGKNAEHRHNFRPSDPKFVWESKSHAHAVTFDDQGEPELNAYQYRDQIEKRLNSLAPITTPTAPNLEVQGRNFSAALPLRKLMRSVMDQDNMPERHVRVTIAREAVKNQEMFVSEQRGPVANAWLSTADLPESTSVAQIKDFMMEQKDCAAARLQLSYQDVERISRCLREIAEHSIEARINGFIGARHMTLPHIPVYSVDYSASHTTQKFGYLPNQQIHPEASMIYIEHNEHIKEQILCNFALPTEEMHFVDKRFLSWPATPAWLVIANQVALEVGNYLSPNRSRARVAHDIEIMRRMSYHNASPPEQCVFNPGFLLEETGFINHPNPPKNQYKHLYQSRNHYNASIDQLEELSQALVMLDLSRNNLNTLYESVEGGRTVYFDRTGAPRVLPTGSGLPPPKSVVEAQRIPSQFEPLPKEVIVFPGTLSLEVNCHDRVNDRISAGTTHSVYTPRVVLYWSGEPSLHASNTNGTYVYHERHNFLIDENRGARYAQADPHDRMVLYTVANRLSYPFLANIRPAWSLDPPDDGNDRFRVRLPRSCSQNGNNYCFIPPNEASPHSAMTDLTDWVRECAEAYQD